MIVVRLITKIMTVTFSFSEKKITGQKHKLRISHNSKRHIHLHIVYGVILFFCNLGYNTKTNGLSANHLWWTDVLKFKYVNMRVKRVESWGGRKRQHSKFVSLGTLGMNERQKWNIPGFRNEWMYTYRTPCWPFNLKIYLVI